MKTPAEAGTTADVWIIKRLPSVTLAVSAFEFFIHFIDNIDIFPLYALETNE